MDDISPEQYQKVLSYMQTANQQNFEDAISIMKQCNFNLDMAINQKFQNERTFPERNAREPQNPQADQQIVRKYVLHLQRIQNEWNLVKIIIDLFKKIILFLLNIILNLLPYSIKTKLFGSQFQKLYYNNLVTNYQHTKLNDYLQKTKNHNSKTVLLIVSPKKIHSDITNFMNNQQIAKKIKQSFYLTCYVSDHDDLKKVQNTQQTPLIVALRMNIFDEIVEISRSRSLNQIKVENLNRWAHDGRNLFKRDCNVLIKYRNYISRFYGHYYQQEQEEQVNLIQRQRDTIQIKQQNDLYKEIEKKAQVQRKIDEQNNRKLQEQMRIKQQQQEERRYRKMSIPDQPTQGNIKRISFRCPNGSTIFRNFDANEKLQLIYHWVELNQQIEFEDESRKFEIMYSFPPQPLSDKKQKSLSQVFQSTQQKVVIRQL